MKKVAYFMTLFLSVVLIGTMGGTTTFAANIKPSAAIKKMKTKKVKVSSDFMKQYKKIDGIDSEQTVLGADFTYYQQDLGWNKTYKNYKSEEIDNLFDFVKSQGINTVSVKVAVHPDEKNEKTACYTLSSAIKTIRQAKKSGLKTNIVLFYSDDITYAGTQTLPDGWNKTNAALKAKEYTKEVLNTLRRSAAVPDMITVGNEVNYNFLNLSEENGWNGWVAMAEIADLIHDAGIKVAVSVSAPAQASGIQYVIEKLQDANVDYDDLGVNLYPDDKTNDYVKVLRQTAEKKAPGKQLIISNVKYPRKSETDSKISEASQAENIYNLLKATIDAKNAGGLIYDEAERVGSWYGFFDEYGGMAQVSLAVFAYAQGNPVDVKIVRDPYQYGDDTGLKEQKVTIGSVHQLSDSTIKGVDASSYIALKNAGVKYYDFDGKEESMLKVLADQGVNYVRLRIWNDPYNEKGETYGGGDCSVENELKIAKEATKYGMRVLIDFQYSDFWADPAKQVLPKAWQKDDGNTEKMCQNIYEYTKDTLQKFKKEGIDIGMVQVGNEITYGMAGIIESRNGGDYKDIWCNKKNYERLDQYLNAGSKAVREVLPQTLVVLHLETPDVEKYTKIMEAWEKGDVDYDVLGSSYYPFWGNTLDGLRQIQNLAAKKGKLFAVLETSWVNSLQDADGTPNSIGSLNSDLKQTYTVGPQGQVDELTGMYKVLTSQDNGLGAFYWEPGWIPVKAGWNNWEYNKKMADQYGTGWASKGAVGYAPDDEMYYNGKEAWGGSSWDNQGLFDDLGYPLQSMKFYKEASSKEKEQTTLITFCDSNGKELKGTTRKIVKVRLGEKTTVTLPNIEGYEPADHNYEVSIQGQTSGVVCKKITYRSDKMETIVLNFCDKNGKKLAKDQIVEVEVGEEQKVELPKISGYLPPDNQYTITVSGMKNGTSIKKIVYTKIPQGTAIKYGYRVKVTSKKYALYKDFSWKKANVNPYNNTYAAKYQYHHENGTTYLSLYTLKGKWVGYIDVKATKKLGAINTPAQGKAIRYGKNVKIISKKYTLYKNFDWKKASTNPYKKTYKAKYRYKHENGTIYLALYTKNGKFVGYINIKAAKVIK